MPKLAATKPNPATMPLLSAPARFGSAPSQWPNAAAASSENSRLTPKTFAGWPAGIGPPFSRFQAAPNNADEYHSPPSRKLDTPAAITAHGFIAASPARRFGILLWQIVAGFPVAVATKRRQLIPAAPLFDSF